jgi:hypothetical protein
MAGNNPKLLAQFYNWSQVPTATEYQNAAAIGAGVVACWQPMTMSGSNRVGIDYAGLLTGVHDSYMASVCAVWAAAPCPVYVRFFHEANLKGGAASGYPWDQGATEMGADVSTRTANFIAYFRYISNFVRAHAPNVRIIWCVNADPADSPTRLPFTQMDPGAAYYDYRGFDWYNYAGLKSAGWHNWTGDSPDYGPIPATYAPLAALTPSKPIIICETNSYYVGGDKSQWLLQGFLSTIPNLMPLVFAACLFNVDLSSGTGSDAIDWRFDAPVSPGAQAAWVRIANDPIYGGTLPRNCPQRQRVTAGPSGVMLAGV